MLTLTALVVILSLGSIGSLCTPTVAVCPTDAVCTATCPLTECPSSWNPNCAEACFARVAPGGTCSTTDLCAANGMCTAGYSCQGGTCAPAGGLGAPCVPGFTNCESGLFCHVTELGNCGAVSPINAAGECAVPGGIDNMCDSDFDTYNAAQDCSPCAPGLLCGAPFLTAVMGQTARTCVKQCTTQTLPGAMQPECPCGTSCSASFDNITPPSCNTAVTNAGNVCNSGHLCVAPLQCVNGSCCSQQTLGGRAIPTWTVAPGSRPRNA